MCVWIMGVFSGLSSLLPPRGFQASTQVIQYDCKDPSLLSHLTGYRGCFSGILSYMLGSVLGDLWLTVPGIGVEEDTC